MIASAHQSPLGVLCLAATPQGLNCATGATCWLTLADPSRNGTHCRRFQRKTNLLTPLSCPTTTEVLNWGVQQDGIKSLLWITNWSAKDKSFSSHLFFHSFLLNPTDLVVNNCTCHQLYNNSKLKIKQHGFPCQTCQRSTHLIAWTEAQSYWS